MGDTIPQLLLKNSMIIFKKKTLPLLNKDFIFFLKNKFGVRPINQRLYLEAITHSSYKNIENNQYDNERLEFLGMHLYRWL